MKERPILFSGAMVRAILAGTKTQTRRIVKPQPASGAGLRVSVPQPANGGASVVFGAVDARGVWSDALRLQCPYGAAGDQLWVRETWRYESDGVTVFCPPMIARTMGVLKRMGCSVLMRPRRR